MTKFPAKDTLIMIIIIIGILVIMIIFINKIIMMMTRFPSVDTLISEVPGSGWMSRSETAK